MISNSDKPTHYDEGTLPEVAAILEVYRHHRKERLLIEYGDASTGEAWGDREIGYIGRSTGTKPILLTVYNNRSLGGPAILTACIVRIITARGKNKVWQHPTYQPFVCPHCKHAHYVQEACIDN